MNIKDSQKKKTVFYYMKKRKLTKNQIEFNKQVKRIKRIKRELEKQGFHVSLNIIERPKRVTKKVLSNLKEIKPITVRKASTQIVNNVLMTAQELYELQKKRRKEQRNIGYVPSDDEVMIQYYLNIKNDIEDVQNLEGASYILGKFNEMEAFMSKEEIGRKLWEMDEQGYTIGYAEMYRYKPAFAFVSLLLRVGSYPKEYIDEVMDEFDLESWGFTDFE